MSTVNVMIDENIVGKVKEGNENIRQASEGTKELSERERVRQEEIIL